MTIKQFFSIFTLPILLLTVSVSVHAQSTPERESLVGLRQVRVLIETIKPEIEQLGLTKRQIQTDVELRLRKAGIIVADTGSATLYVNVNIGRVSNMNVYVYCINIDLDQGVILARNKSIITVASTWSNGRTGAVGSVRFLEIRSDVGEILDRFINDFLAANPK
jgi:hypothetical protein